VVNTVRIDESFVQSTSKPPGIDEGRATLQGPFESYFSTCCVSAWSRKASVVRVWVTVSGDGDASMVSVWRR